VGYYLRAFCRSDELPPLRLVFEWVANEGIGLELPASSALIDDSEWRQATIRYKADRQPLIVDVDRANSDGDLLSDEVEEFVELLEDVADSPEKQKVVAQLRSSRAVVSVQLSGDIDEDGDNAVATFLRYFVEYCGAMIQADGGGFYEGDRVLVELMH
jgi:hypothetical protein